MTLSPNLKTEYPNETQYRKPGLMLGSGSFVEINIFAEKYYFMWFLNILLFFSEIYANAWPQKRKFGSFVQRYSPYSTLVHLLLRHCWNFDFQCMSKCLKIMKTLHKCVQFFLSLLFILYWVSYINKTWTSCIFDTKWTLKILLPLHLLYYLMFLGWY